MNTTNIQPSAPDSASAGQKSAITEADVVAFLTAKAAELSTATNESYCEISVIVLNACYGSPAVATWRTYVNDDKFRSAETLSGAFDASVSAMSRDIRARELREQAAQLIARADSPVPDTAGALAAHVVAISDDANIGEAIALVPELEAIVEEAKAAAWATS